MIRFTFTYLKQIVLYITISFLFHNCVTYNKQPVSIEEAINVDHKIVKPIKIELNDDQKLILDSIYYKNNQLYGVSKEKTKIPVSETKYTYNKKPYTYTYNTIEKTKIEVKIDENKIKKILLPDRPKNNIYVNICGDVSFYSINYERLFKVSPTLILAGGLGIGQSVTDIVWGDLIRTIPHHITLNYGKKRSFFEFGIGGVHTIDLGPYDKGEQKYFIYPIIGYRIQPLRPIVRFFFRIHGCYPVTIFEDSRWHDPLITYIGISLGISF